MSFASQVAKTTLPGMLERGRGDLINLASIAGWDTTLHSAPANAAKFAVVPSGSR